MFESIARWFESLDEESRLFENADQEVLHGALASVLYHLISADQHVSSRERRRFESILQEEFALDDAQVAHLYEAASATASDVHSDLQTIATHLKANPGIRMAFMRKLIQLVNLDGTREEELAVFYGALHEVFPDLRQT